MGSIALSHNGKTIYSNSVGYAQLGDSLIADSLTRYRIGSISKVFTATLTLKAAEEGKITLQTSLSKYFPKIQHSDSITIENLLNHSSGIYDFTLDEDYMGWNTSYQSRLAMLGRITKGSPKFNPGTKNEYSNSNYVLLSFILEDIYDKTFGELLKMKIIVPAGLHHTSYGGKINPKSNEAASYSYLGSWEKEPETDLSIPQGAGGIISTAQDLNKFMVHLFSGKIISEKSVDKMKIFKGSFGLGLFKFPYDEKLSYGHTGGIDGFRSVSSYFPEEGLAVSLLSNALNYNKNIILLAVLANYFNKPFELPKFEQNTVSADDLEKFTGTYSSTEIPPKITISRKDDVLIGQATGQSAFPLKSVSQTRFTFEQAGIELIFNPAKNTMLLKQGGGEFHFEKE
jgi:CubicO group peptidase (beta-lactamase class C family)